MGRQRQRIDRQVAARAHPDDAVEVEVALFIEARPPPEIRSMQPFHRATLPLERRELTPEYADALVDTVLAGLHVRGEPA